MRFRRRQADTARYGDSAGWHTDGDMVRTAYTLRAEDDDWGQAGTLVRDVMSRRAGTLGGQRRWPPPERSQ